MEVDLINSYLFKYIIDGNLRYLKWIPNIFSSNRNTATTCLHEQHCEITYSQQRCHIGITHEDFYFTSKYQDHKILHCIIIFLEHASQNDLILQFTKLYQSLKRSSCVRAIKVVRIRRYVNYTFTFIVFIFAVHLLLVIFFQMQFFVYQPNVLLYIKLWSSKPDPAKC